MLQHPLALGADVVVYFDDQAHRRTGPLPRRRRAREDRIRGKLLQEWLRQTGPSMSPFNAWVMLKGLETLPIRIQAQCAAAAKIADLLAGWKGISRVIYPGRADHPQADLAARQMPGGGQMIAFEVEGGKKAAFKFLNALRLILISNNLEMQKVSLRTPQRPRTSS